MCAGLSNGLPTSLLAQTPKQQSPLPWQSAPSALQHFPWRHIWLPLQQSPGAPGQTLPWQHVQEGVRLPPGQ